MIRRCWVFESWKKDGTKIFEEKEDSAARFDGDQDSGEMLLLYTQPATADSKPAQPINTRQRGRWMIGIIHISNAAKGLDVTAKSKPLG